MCRVRLEGPSVPSLWNRTQLIAGLKENVCNETKETHACIKKRENKLLVKYVYDVSFNQGRKEAMKDTKTADVQV